MKGAAVREEVWRDEKLRLLESRRAGLAGRDGGLVAGWPALVCETRLPLFKLPPTLPAAAVESPPLLLRLLLLPLLTVDLDRPLAAGLPPAHTDCAEWS